MSATEQMRAMLDGLMGTARDGSDSKRQHLNFTDQRVCRAFLLDCCPHDIFASTKLELGECPKVHDPALRADYILANKTEDYMYELSALERLQAFVNDADKKTEYLKRKLAETQEELTAEETSKLNRVHDLTEKLGKKLAQVDKAEADGDAEAKQKFQEEAERIKKERVQAEAEYRLVSRPASSHQQQNLRVCDVCSAYLGINDNDSRLADHFGGKLHLGFITVREKLEDLKKRCADTRGRGGGGGGGAAGPERDYGDYGGRDRHYRDRDRDRGRDRERDRDRDRAREDKYRDRERDRSRSGSRYYRDVRYGSRGPRDPPRRDYSPRDRDYAASSRDHPSSRDNHMSSSSRDRPRYRDDRSDRERNDRDRLDRPDRHAGGAGQAPPSSASRSRPAGPFDRANAPDSGRYHESEISYQRKLREWEKREDEKARKFAIREAEEKERRLLEEQESRKLKEFLEDYKDDRDDIRFYRGSALARRLADRRKEAEQDELCRQKERMDLEILSRSCAANNPNSPSQVVGVTVANLNEPSATDTTTTTTTTTTTAAAAHEIPLNGSDIDKSQELNIANRNETTLSTNNNNNNNHSSLGASSTSQQQMSNRGHPSNHNKISSSEEKRKQVEELIGKIPTDKEQLFARQLDWSLLDENLMEKRIRPWVTKKIAEYMGEKEVELIDFICALLNDHKDGNSMLKEVAIVLDDEAEKFVVHMWRLLIFELEAKRIGLRK